MFGWRGVLTPKWIITTLLVLVGTVVCVRLGIWQLDRLAQRRAFNAHYIETANLPPLELDADPQVDLTAMEYRQVSVIGEYDFNENIVRRNQSRDSQPGYALLTPLILQDGTAILIERGWIPAEGNANPADWRKYDQPGLIKIKGILRLGQKKAEVGSVTDPPLSPGQSRLDFWNQVNLERIRLQVPYKLLPVFVQPESVPGQSSPPFPTQPVIEISDGPHIGYAAQWFAFASILFFGYPFFLRKQLTSPATEAELEENL